MPSKLPARSAVDKNIARVMRDADLVDNLPRCEIGKILFPRRVGCHSVHRHLTPERDAGLHGKHDGGGKFGEDEIEGDPQERHCGSHALPMHLAGARHRRCALSDEQAAHSTNLPEDANVQDESDERQGAKHDNLRRPVPVLIDAFQINNCIVTDS